MFNLVSCSRSFFIFIFIFYKSNVYSAEARAYVTLHKQRGLTTSNDPSLSVYASLYSRVLDLNLNLGTQGYKRNTCLNEGKGRGCKNLASPANEHTSSGKAGHAR